MSTANRSQSPVPHADCSHKTSGRCNDGVQDSSGPVGHRIVPLRLDQTPSASAQNCQLQATRPSVQVEESRPVLSVISKATSVECAQESCHRAPRHGPINLTDRDRGRAVPAKKISSHEQQKLKHAKKRTGTEPKHSAQGDKVRPSIRKHSQSRVRRRVPQGMQLQWRVGAAPSVALALSKEESQMSKVVAQAVAFYSSMFEVMWRPSIHVDPFVFDLDNRVEVFRDSSVTASCLVAAGKVQLAQELLDRVLPSVEDLLRNPHPQLYLILAELALGLVRTPDDRLRDQIKWYLAARTSTILGPDHPITVLLNLHLPRSQNEFLGERIWAAVLPVLAHTFGPDHYQSSTQVFCHARNMASCGRVEDAVRSIEALIDRWGQVYGNNSLIVCYSKIELANVLVAAGSHMKGEFVVCDALRTSDMIHAAELRNEECHVSERRHRESSIAFPRVAGLRTLGRLHKMRGNLGAATYYFSQAVAIGSPSLGKNSAVVELAQDDLNASRVLELRQAQQQFALADLSNLTNIVPSPVC